MYNNLQKSINNWTTLFSLIGLLSIVPFLVEAQQSLGGTPFSFAQPRVLAGTSIPSVTITKPNLNKLQVEDDQRAKNGSPLRYAVFQPANIQLSTNGIWTNLPNGDRVWQLKIQAPEAQAINLLYNEFYLPKGSRLYIYNLDKSEVLGAFSELNNKKSGVFATGNVSGEAVVVEYYEPAVVAGKGRISISDVGYVYRYAQHPLAKNSDPCEVDVNCSPEGNDWQDEKKGVVRISVVDGQGAGWCTGSLINNTAQNCKPYILTALHCGENSTANHFNQYIFYFNYESSGCGVNDAPTNQSVTGCVKRADSGDGGGNSGSDYLLVELNNPVPANYDVYYNGWNAKTAASNSGVSIHHPAGDRKKISTYNATLRSNQWGSANGSHWEVTWVSSANGHGVTEGGSSGSPIFDNSGKIVGQLTGGSSYCTSPNDSDLYGKMSYNWTSNPGDDLKPFLDPTNSGTLELEGSAEPCNGGSTPTCSDGIQNGNETGVDCGGSDCEPCVTPPTCSDGIQNGNETGVDCGGSDCEPCVTPPTCSDGIQNGNETGVDCGGSDCEPCATTGCENIRLVINPDDYGNETTWDIRQNGTIVESGGPYTEGNTNTITEDFCLPIGCYTLTVYDEENDGLCCDYGVGSYQLEMSDGTLLVEGAEFGSQESNNFCLQRNTALPINWLSFTTKKSGKAIELVWSTADENENMGFYIQRSKNGTDWGNLTWIAAAKTARAIQQYKYIDHHPLKGNSYYRLQQMDNSSSMSYSEIRQVSLAITAEAFNIYPNPLRTGSLQLEIPAFEQETQLIITDQFGRQLATYMIGNEINTLNLIDLAAGVYWLSAIQGNQRWTQKLVKL